jgi:hypothetical protein
MKSVRPWPANTPCPQPSFAEFKKHLNSASYHNAAEGCGEMGDASLALQKAAQVAIDAEWPYWAMERMFKEVAPLVDWGSFMQKYINILSARRG